MSIWKVLGLAGAAGVAATGVVVVRNERRRAQLTPGEVRSRLRQRYAETAGSVSPIVPDHGPETPTPPRSRPWPRWGSRLRRR